MYRSVQYVCCGGEVCLLLLVVFPFFSKADYAATLRVLGKSAVCTLNMIVRFKSQYYLTMFGRPAMVSVKYIQAGLLYFIETHT